VRVQRRVVISGQVQGVFFRQSTRDYARELGLTGWVRNRLDGCVEAVFQGPAAAVARMVEWCRRGPPLADVEHVELTEEPLGDPFPGFSVR
jgi:acylphosphatase